YLGDEIFWGPAGDSGPCGPSTDVFFDTGNGRDELSSPEGRLGPAPRFFQIWNAGNFMELDKRPDGTYGKLRFHSVDSGSGLERIAMAVNGFSTVYDIDLLRPILADVEQQLHGSGLHVADLRVLADHLRAVTFILSEGVVPANKGRGHVPRRLIRRCVAIITRAGVPEFDFAGVIDGIIERSSADYPLLAHNRPRIIEKFLDEKRDFERVIREGFARLKRLCEGPSFSLTVGEAFALCSCYGMPPELVRDFVRARGVRFDEEGFKREFRRHQGVSRAGRPAGKAVCKGGT
ncbi:MAG TPA: alanine--tRNA ligase-related protein, partial [Pyrinomonadaceae bacterium]